MSLEALAIRALFFAVLGFAALAQEIAVPPIPPALITQPVVKKISSVAAATPEQFSIGNPTDDEQLQLELINRARTNAPAEALRLLALNEPYVQAALTKVDAELMKSQFATNPPAAPLSFNAKLITAARAHTQYLFDNAIQSHYGPGPTDTLANRLSTVAYPYSTAGENVFAYSPNSEVGHAGFEVDWNGTTSDGGMQTPPGHRDSIHNPTFTEVGIGVVSGTNTVITPTRTNTVGPMVITQDFGRPQTVLPYITGVAYYDINTNNFYDLGEGCGGVRVTVDGIDTFAITTSSGGYSIPVPANASYTVRFNTSGMSETVKQITLNGAANYKLDFNPPFVAPSVAAVPSITFTGVSNLYTIAPLPGATGYRAKVQKVSAIPMEGAEGPLTNVTFTKFGAYTNISTIVHSPGSLKSFRLAHTNGVSFPGLQIMEFNRPFFIRAGGKVDFLSRLGIASSNQVAQLEVSEDRADWTTIWSQAGKQLNGGVDTSEKTLNAKSVSLTNFLGKILYARFTFSFTNAGFFFPLNGAGNDAAKGWYIDNILFTNAPQADEGTTTDIGSEPTFRFAPTTTGDYIVSIQALNGTRVYPLGDARFVTTQANPPTLALVSNPTPSGSNISFQFTVTGTVTPYALDSSNTPNGPWTLEPNAVFNGPTTGRYTVTVTSNGSLRFYRVRAN